MAYSLLMRKLNALKTGMASPIGVYMRLLTMDKITLEQAMANAPSWATHISVLRDTGWPEYYNAFDKRDLSVPVTHPDVEPALLGHSFSHRLHSGDTIWDAIPIHPVSLLNE